MRPVNVLVADDDESIRSFLRIALSHEDGVGEIREAANGFDAVTIARSWDPHVVVLDYWMPLLDGGGAARQIRLAKPRVPIVAFSGVLQATPEWADHSFLKGELPDLALVVQLGRDALARLPQSDPGEAAV
ncbi:MAG: response regulator [Actinomycetota bacterium]|nr:response regulator [Actinomycetota bacterium]